MESVETPERGRQKRAFSLWGEDQERWSWGRRRTTGEPVSSLPHLTEQQVNEQVEKLTAQLQLMTSDRDELRDRLAFSTNPVILDESESSILVPALLLILASRLPFVRRLVRLFLSFPKCETVFPIIFNFHRQLLNEKSHLKAKVEMQSREIQRLLLEQNLLQKSSEDRNWVCEENRKICDLQAQQQQEKRERKPQCLLRQKELLTEQSDMALQMEQYFTNSEIRFTDLRQELDQMKNKNTVLDIDWRKMSAELKTSSRSWNR